MTQAEKEILNLPISIHEWDFLIELTKRYDDYEIGRSSEILKKISDFTW